MGAVGDVDPVWGDEDAQRVRAFLPGADPGGIYHRLDLGYYRADARRVDLQDLYLISITTGNVKQIPVFNLDMRLMMSDDTQPQLRLNQQILILPPADERALVIPASIWSRFIQRLEKAQMAESYFQSIGWSLISIAMTCLIGAFALLPGAIRSGTYIAAVAFLVCGIMSLFFYKKESKSRDAILHIVLEDMRSYNLIGNIEDSPEWRKSYRAVAYLSEFVRQHLQNNDLFSTDEYNYRINPNPSEISLDVTRKEDQVLFHAKYEIFPDWPGGTSWAYAGRIAEHLLKNIVDQITKRNSAHPPV